MADYISTLNGQQMDAALMDMAEHNSEAWAVGERNGIPVGSDDVTYQNNAQYYAQQAQSIAPASVTEAVRWDIAQTALTDANKEQARSNIDAGKNGAWSNRNLLDNAYFVGGGSQLGDGVFPINQKGQTVYTSDGPSIDRWKQYAATVTLASDGVTVAPSAYSNNFLQLMNPAKWNALVGETVTLSIEVLAVTGTITVAGYNTGIGTITSTGIAAFTFTMPSGIADGNKFFGIAGQSGSSIKFSRWKLEKGTVSTLPNDPPPNYWTELQKCKARLRFVPLTRCPIVLAAGNAYLDLNGCEMEGNPTAALYSNDGAVVGSSGASSAITSVTNIGINHNVPLLQFNLASAINDQVGQIYNTVVQLSSEL